MVVIFSKTFSKNYDKLPSLQQNKFKARFLLFKTNTHDPLLKNHSLHGSWTGHRSINITADIRAIYKEKPGSIIFVAIGTHSELYE